MTEIGVFGTIALCVTCWAVAEYLRTSRRRDCGRVAWTTGAVAMAVHSVWAFAVFYGWDQQTALTATGDQTQALTGMRWSAGLYINYLLLGVWAADTAWWWVSPRRYLARSRPLDVAVRGFLFFMFVNGFIVFADGLMRVLGMLAVGTVALAWLTKHYQPAAL